MYPLLIRFILCQILFRFEQTVRLSSTIHPSVNLDYFDALFEVELLKSETNLAIDSRQAQDNSAEKGSKGDSSRCRCYTTFTLHIINRRIDASPEEMTTKSRVEATRWKEAVLRVHVEKSLAKVLVVPTNSPGPDSHSASIGVPRPVL